MTVEYLKFAAAIAVVISPFWLVARVTGKAGIVFLLTYIGVIVGGFFLLQLLFWSIQTALMAIGFTKEEVNKERNKTPWIIFWRN